MYLLSDIADKINGQLVGSDKKIVEVSEIDSGKSKSLSFIDNPLYLKCYSTTECGALIVSKDFKPSDRKNISLIKVDNPRLGLLKAIQIIYKNQTSQEPTSKDTSFIHNDASIGDNFRLGSNCVISTDVSIGDNVVLHNNVVIEKGSIVGDNTIIQSGTVIGSDGFGTVLDKEEHLNFPHIGNVVIGRDVWIGSNVSIDRGTIGDTVIGDNTKIDNIVQIAHNVKIGKSCLIVSGTAIAGTTAIGNNVSIGGQVGITGHLKIGDNCLIGAKSLVTKSFAKGLFLSGNPAKIHKDRVKEEIALRELPQYIKKIKEL